MNDHVWNAYRLYDQYVRMEVIDPLVPLKELASRIRTQHPHEQDLYYRDLLLLGQWYYDTVKNFAVQG